MTVQTLLLCAFTLCMNYVINTFLLVKSSVRSKQLLCFLHGQGQKSKQKPRTKNFLGFHNHSPVLTMCRAMQIIIQKRVIRQMVFQVFSVPNKKNHSRNE